MLYRKTALTDAIQWTGENLEECKEFAGASYDGIQASKGALVIDNPAGLLHCNVGDWLARQPDDHTDVWVIEKVPFEGTYEPYTDTYENWLKGETL